MTSPPMVQLTARCLHHLLVARRLAGVVGPSRASGECRLDCIAGAPDVASFSLAAALLIPLMHQHEFRQFQIERCINFVGVLWLNHHDTASVGQWGRKDSWLNEIKK